MKRKRLFVLLAMIVGLGVGYIYSIDFFSLPYGASFLSWKVEGSEVAPAVVERGKNLEMEIEAIAAFDTDEFEARVFMEIDGMIMEYPIDESHFGLIDASLPLETGKIFTCKLDIPILEALPLMSMSLYVIFEGQNDGVIAGGGIDIQIVESKSAR